LKRRIQITVIFTVFILIPFLSNLTIITPFTTREVRVGGPIVHKASAMELQEDWHNGTDFSTGEFNVTYQKLLMS
jgi:hypothetical protein